jgi:multidrug efflux pump subunit AcrB
VSTLLFRNPRLLLLVLGVIVALATSAASSIGRQEDPSITNLFASVVTPFPGAEPARVEALVTETIEEELQTIGAIDTLTSDSRAGISLIAVELAMDLSETEIEQTWSEIRDALGAAARELPPGVPDPELDTDRSDAFTTLSALVMAEDRAPQPIIQARYAERLQDRLRQLPDTKIVRLFGEPEAEIRVTIDRQELAGLGLEYATVAQAIAEADAKVRAGTLHGSQYELLLEVDGAIERLDRVRAIPLETHMGATLRLGAIAQIERTVADPPRALAYSDGRRAVLVAARMENDRQVDVWTEAARAVMADFERALPEGLEHRLVFDQSQYTSTRFAELARNLALGITLVLGILFLTLGWRGALVVAAVLPLAALLSLTGMFWVGLPLQQMSVTGLIVALGLLVDGAIVMSDQIQRRLEQGLPRLAAVGGAVQRLAVPLTASTVTTVLAFLPMAVLPGAAGDFVGSIALAVIIMLTVSLALALTVTPAIAGWLLRRSEPSDAGFLTRGLQIPRLSRAFARSIDASLQHKGVALLGALTLPVMGFAAFPTLTAQFFPGVDRNQFYIQVTLPDGTAIGATDRLVARIDARLADRRGIERRQWVVGESAPPFYYNMLQNRDRLARFAEALITTRSAAATERLIPALQAELDRAYPSAQIIVRGLKQGPPVDAPVELRLVGPDLETLRALGAQARAFLAEVPEITHTRADLLGGAPKLRFTLDEDKVRQAGLTLAGVARQMEAGLGGAIGGSLIEATEAMPVRVRLGEDQRAGVAAVESLRIMPPNPAAGDPRNDLRGIPLSALGSLELVPADSRIARRNGERVNLVQGFVARGVLPQEALTQVQARLAADPLPLPPGYRLEYGGERDARSETTGNLAASAGLVVTLTVVTLFLTFGSYRLLGVASLAAGLAAGLSLLALAIFGYPFGIQALIGTIGSIGVSVNAAIIILTALQQDPAAARGDPAAMREVVTGSARHIVSTTLTTASGFVPLILAGGGFWPPFAMAIAGGVLLSSVVSFYFVPPMYALVRDRGRPRTRAGDVGGTGDRTAQRHPSPFPSA